MSKNTDSTSSHKETRYPDGFQRVVRVWSGEQIPASHCNLNFTSVLPQFYLHLTSYLPQFNLCSAGNLEPRFRNHDLQTLGYPPPSIVAHVCGDPLSRYTCRATRVAADILRILGFFRCSSSIALHPPPLKGPVAPVVLERPGVSHVKLPLKRCRATGGCSSYTCGCRTTLCN